MLSIERFDNGKLTPEEADFITEALIPGLKQNIGDRLIIKRPEDTTWAGLRNFIETENFSTPLDLIVIDYFANMNTVAAKDKTAYINAAAYEAKQFVLHDLDNGRGGVALLSPAHGSRKGTEDAARDEGNWKREGVYMFSELEKAADMIFFTFLDTPMQSTGYIKVGTCKSRRSADVPAQLVAIDHGTHYIGGSKPKNGSKSAAATSSTKSDALTKVQERLMQGEK